ncbi:MAG: hypothetical protein ABIG87_02865 [Patescibacteria group bacterium]
MFNKKYQPTFRSSAPQKQRGGFRVRGPIKSFRDLDVYTKTTSLSAEIFLLKSLENFDFVEELQILKTLAKQVPKMIAESYGNRFDNFSLATRKLEKTAEMITAVISKIDFLISVLDNTKVEQVAEQVEQTEQEIATLAKFKEKISRILKDYSINRAKVLNLKKAWIRINENFSVKRAEPQSPVSPSDK